MSEKRFDPSNLHKLDNPERRKALPPEQILGLLKLNETDIILDLGAGSGYFTIPAAQLTKGQVYALEVEKRMLEALRERVDAEGLSNVELVEGAIEEIPLQDGLADHVIASLVLHEVEPLSKGLKEIQRMLKPGGNCLCLEWEKKETPQGPPLHHRIHSDEMKQAVEQAGFTVESVTFPTDSHYILIFGK
ncbi:class I SAM-dependent methyltransferase [Ferviditalea candida]|uniref:Class I SAM-dependent methyltransferase n=1 Tax=Ferviditalea candida TaxID=3108399 RepID=A0ABU5ZIU2_9BACL|nr:class I SAM-dependent methyltransferase [Paenibacillaceae bacterium T2]